jgi:hypothetical protein
MTLQRIPFREDIDESQQSVPDFKLLDAPIHEPYTSLSRLAAGFAIKLIELRSTCLGSDQSSGA